jgi:hypothetical protein
MSITVNESDVKNCGTSPPSEVLLVSQKGVAGFLILKALPVPARWHRININEGIGALGNNRN